MRISDWSSDVCSSDLLFVAVTLEESGLLGSAYYAAHPAIPLDHTVGVINVDAMGVSGRSRDITVVGMGRDRQSVVKGKSVSVRVDLGGRRIIKKKKNNIQPTRRNSNTPRGTEQ